MNKRILVGLVLAGLVLVLPGRSYADDGTATTAGGFSPLLGSAAPLLLSDDATSQPATNGGNQYGPLGLLDHRSLFGTGFFPEPFLVDEGDMDSEVAFSWLHEEGHAAVSDQYTAEVEWTFGLTTFEVEATYERDTFPDTGTGLIDSEQGMDNVEITARRPIWQWISPDEQIDNTVVVGFELAIPTNTAVGQGTELVPAIYDLLRIGDHWGLQTHVGYSTLLGADPLNQQTLEYSADLSYSVDRSLVPLPKGVGSVTAILELAGERGLNAGDLSDHLDGVLGARFNLDSIGDISPRLGIGFVFPIDKQARGDFDWGIITSLVFDL